MDFRSTTPRAWDAARVVVMVVVGGMVAACASTTPSRDRIAAPSAAISAAQEVGAQEHPQAAYHLKLAQEQYDEAKRLIDEGEGEQADRLLERALSDARLAYQESRLHKTRARADRAVLEVQELRQEFAPGQDSEGVPERQQR